MFLFDKLEAAPCFLDLYSPWNPLGIKEGIANPQPIPQLVALVAGALRDHIVEAFLLQQQRIWNYNVATSQGLHPSTGPSLQMRYQVYRWKNFPRGKVRKRN